MKLKDRKLLQESGFALLESLVSLTILTVILMISIPFTVELLSFRDQQKEGVELSRVLFDAAREWSGTPKESRWETVEETYTIQLKEEGIAVFDSVGNKQILEVQSSE